MSENLRDYTKALYGFDAVVQRVPADRWDEATPCEGWCARDLVLHAATVADAVAAMARTGEVHMPETPEPTEDVVGCWNNARDSVLEALDHPGVIKRVGNYWFGESTLDHILGFGKWDPLVHSWDLGRAVGVDPHPDPELAAKSFDTISPLAEDLRGFGLLADPVEVPRHADAMSRLLGLAGRNPAG